MAAAKEINEYVEDLEIISLNVGELVDVTLGVDEALLHQPHSRLVHQRRPPSGLRAYGDEGVVGLLERCDRQEAYGRMCSLGLE